MNVLVAPDSFKGTLSAVDVCRVVKKALEERFADVNVVCVPVADGGEGTVECFHTALPGSVLKTYRVDDLYHRPCDATVCFDGDRCVVETASAAGLDHTRPDVCHATTFGLGQVVRHALCDGARHLVLGLGGSGTCDGGIGMAAALGARFTDADGNDVPLCGNGLEKIEHIDLSGLDARLKECRIEAACDVTSPLYGKEGSAYVFAPQKGASPRDVERLDAGLRHLADVVRRDFGFDLNTPDGAGAAGGLGAAVKFFLGGTLVPGLPLVLKTAGFDALVRDADVVLTGEGCADAQSLAGKVPVGVARASAPYAKPVVCLCGVRGDGWERLLGAGIYDVVCINPPDTDFATAKRDCEKNLYQTVQNYDFSFVKMGERG